MVTPALRGHFEKNGISMLGIEEGVNLFAEEILRGPDAEIEVVLGPPAFGRMSCTFEPIAIIGRGCIFPGALDPAAFWKLIFDGGNAISSVAPDRWRVPVASVLGQGPEKTLTDRGGYVTGFVPTELQHLDQLAQWLLYCARQALKEAGI